MSQSILVTGGLGFIGSHTTLLLQQAGYQVVILDNLSNASAEVQNRLAQLSGQKPVLVKGDILDPDCLARLFEQYSFNGVIHFAGLKAVGESAANPLRYYQENVWGSVNLFKAMAAAGCKNIVFSSSATVYGDPDVVPIPETAATRPANPYGKTKLFIEEILRDLAASDPQWRAVLLRYFNPVGAHPSGSMGEDPKGVPNNLMPFVSQVAVGKREKLSVFGNDYPTSDGTGVRDYIHVMDLARAHLAAIDKIASLAPVSVYNIGMGKGVSVLELINTFRAETGRDVPFEFAPRRAGDVAELCADPSQAEKDLQWKAELTLADMVRDSWRWQESNPNGYED